MATLWIREYESLHGAPVLIDGALRPGATIAPIASETEVVDQTPVTFSDSSQQSAAFATSTRFIAIIASVPFHYKVATSPVATTSHLKIPADTLIYVGVRPGDRVAAIAAA